MELARDFSELRAADHALVLDNRLGQWLNRPGNAYLQGLDLTQMQLTLYHGWELADGTVTWQQLYQGVVQQPRRHGPRLEPAASGPSRAIR